jgi:hypothetical protein
MVQAGVIPQERLNWRNLSGGIREVVMHCCGDCQPVRPVVLLGRRQMSQIALNPLILSLGQSVGLGVEGCRDVLLDVQDSRQSFREVGCEARVSVRYYFSWKSKPSVNVVHVELCHTFSRDRRFTREEEGRSSASVVNDRQDGIIASGGG